jgi:hypothetical protein
MLTTVFCSAGGFNMRKGTLLFLLLALLAAVIAPISAQEGQATEEPTAEVSANQDSEVEVTTIRLAHFAPDAPVLVAYVNGQPSGIQDLAYPSLSGWVEIPTGSTLSLIPQGASQSSAVLGPLNITAADNWTTIVFVGSAAGGTLAAYAIQENLGAIPEGCAMVTVFHAIEGAPAVDLLTDDGTALARGIGFPGSGLSNATGGDMGGGTDMQATEEAGTDAAATEEAGADMTATEESGTTGTDPCAGEMMGTGTDMQATEEAAATEDAAATEEAGADMTVTEDPMATEEAGMGSGDMAEGGMSAMTFATAGAVDCVALPLNMATADASATEEAGAAPTEEAAATEEAGAGSEMRAQSMGGGETFGGCGYTLLVPAGTYNLQVVGSGGTDALLNLSGTTLEAGLHYFVAAVGTTDAPQVFALSTAGMTNNQ